MPDQTTARPVFCVQVGDNPPHHLMDADEATDLGLDVDRIDCPEHDAPAVFVVVTGPAAAARPTTVQVFTDCSGPLDATNDAGEPMAAYRCQVNGAPAEAEAPAVPGLPPIPDLWQSYAGEDARVYAGLFHEAAALIMAAGYDAHDDYEGASGISIASALAEVARGRAGAELEQGRAVYGDDQWARRLTAAADMWRRELEIRLAAVLYATGQQLYDHSTHLTDVSRDWEMHWNSDAPRPDQGRAVGLLTTAAAVCDLLGAITADARNRAAAALEGN